MRCKAAEELAGEGIEAEVIDLRTIRPLDIETVVAIGEEDRPLRHRRGRLAADAASAREIAARVMEARVRLSRRAGAAGHRQGRADALRRQSRKARAAAASTEVVAAAKAVCYR